MDVECEPVSDLLEERVRETDDRRVGDGFGSVACVVCRGEIGDLLAAWAAAFLRAALYAASPAGNFPRCGCFFVVRVGDFFRCLAEFFMCWHRTCFVC